MNRSVVAVLVSLLLTSCGQDESLRGRLDALSRDYAHNTSPSPERQIERGTLREHAYEHSTRKRMESDPNARAILEQGEAAVPGLIALLRDPERRTRAMSFLAEIGGETAAKHLLETWRTERGRAKNKHVRHLDRRGLTSRTIDGIDAHYYGELIFALKYVGRPVLKDIIYDTAHALTASSLLERDGENVLLQEQRDEPDGRLQLSWRAEPIETACEGLAIATSVGGEGVEALVAEALRSPVVSIRWCALQSLHSLEPHVEHLLPTVVSLMEDSEVRSEALSALQSAYGGVEFPPKAPDSEKGWADAVQTWRDRVAREPSPSPVKSAR